MKKTVLVMVLLAALYAACKHGGDDFDPLPDGVYILGIDYDYYGGVFSYHYWRGDSRVELESNPDILFNYFQYQSITVYEGKVLVVAIDYILHESFYWLDGVRHALPERGENGLQIEYVTVTGGDLPNDYGEGRIVIGEFPELQLQGGGPMGELRYIWVDGERVAVDLPEGSLASNYYIAKDGTIYMAGAYRRGKKVQACYWVDGVRYDLASPGNVDSRATAIYVEE